MAEMEVRFPFLELDPLADMLTHALRADPEINSRATQAKSANAMFPRYRTRQGHNALVLEVELPGADRSTIALDVNRKHISVSAKRPVWTGSDSARNTKNVEVVKVSESKTTITGHAEKGGGTEQAVTGVRADEQSINYSAKFRIGYDVVVDAVTAEFKEGILSVRLPRDGDTKAVRRVSVRMHET